MPTRFDRLRLRVARWLRWARRVVALGLLVAAALLAAGDPAGRPAPAEETALVLTAAHDLGPGHVIGRADLASAAWPHRLVPAGALGPDDDAVGRVVAGAVARGEVISAVRLLGPGLAAALGPGVRAVPVRLTDAGVSALLRPGDRIDLYAVDVDIGASTPTEGELVAGNALVVGVPATSNGAVPEGAVVVVAVPLGEVPALVGAAYSRSLAASLAPP